jgi:hypothetical protein
MIRKWIQFGLMALSALVVATATTARADVAFLMEEPYGGFGSVNPTGHAALYFNHICAETPTRLRACQPGEQGVVISRYHKVGGYDWLAIPLVPYLYAVERVEDVPKEADVRLRDELRDRYRRANLDAIAPDVATEYGTWASPKGDWYQLVGSSYDRRIYGFQIETTADEDSRFMAQYNDHRNISHFNLFFHNCADFSRTVLNGFFPHAVTRNYLADFGLTTPKQVARSLEKYAKKNPEIPYIVFMIPQVPGTIARSHRINGVAESLVKSKKYVIPMALFYPEVAGVVGVTYLTQGRFSAPKDAHEVMLPGEDARVMIARQQVLGTAAESADAQPGVDVEYKKRSLDDHGVNLERRESDGVAGSLGGSTE